MPDNDLRRLAMRGLLSLPAPLLRAFSGGAAAHRAGRTLDPRAQFLAHHARRRADQAPPGPLDLREQAAAVDRELLGRLEPGVQVEAMAVPGAGGELQARLYRPGVSGPAQALLVWFPSGGGIVPGLSRDEPFCSILAALARAPVLAVQPRLAPEHRFPAPLEDAVAAWRWARDAAGDLGARQGRAGVGGADLGGGLAAAVCQGAAEAGEAQPELQLLLTPWLDLASEAASMTLFGDAWPLGTAEVVWRAGQVLGAEGDPADPRASPLKRQSLSGLAPATIVTAGFDPLADQGEAYARRLRDARAPVRYRRYDALTHDFHTMTGVLPAADAACREIAGLLLEALEEPAEAAG